jgi:hypothetical protein
VLESARLAFGAICICLAIYWTGRTVRLLLEQLILWTLDRLAPTNNRNTEDRK